VDVSYYHAPRQPLLRARTEPLPFWKATVTLTCWRIPSQTRKEAQIVTTPTAQSRPHGCQSGGTPSDDRAFPCQAGTSCGQGRLIFTDAAKDSFSDQVCLLSTTFKKPCRCLKRSHSLVVSKKTFGPQSSRAFLNLAEPQLEPKLEDLFDERHGPEGSTPPKEYQSRGAVQSSFLEIRRWIQPLGAKSAGGMLPSSVSKCPREVSK